MVWVSEAPHLPQVEVSLNDNVIGKGTGSSKKRAEQDAARAALELLQQK